MPIQGRDPVAVHGHTHGAATDVSRILRSATYLSRLNTVQTDRNRELSDRYMTVVKQLFRMAYIVRLNELRGPDMTVPQIKTLILIEHLGPLRMGELTSYLGSGLSTTTSIVDRLVRKNLVQRDSDPSDRRVVVCKLTLKGREATEEFLNHITARALMVSDRWDVVLFEKVVQSLELIWRTKEALHANSETIPSTDSVS
ncbi:MAG: MarR family transcriptional regulator [Gemmatimonadetes bacterium]|nr:MarR family transcriptional regulator [Gemmatimonadota bacterium]